MRGTYIGIGLIIGFLIATIFSFVGVAHALSVYSISQGGTNASTFTTSGNAVYYDGTRLVTAGTAAKVTTPYASSTSMTVTGSFYVVGTASTSNLTVSNLGNTITNCLQISNAGVVSATGSACAASGGGTYPFTGTTYNGVPVSATSSPIWDTYTGIGPGLIASTTFFTQASSTQFTNSGNTWLTALTSGRIPFASTAGLLQDSAALLWSSAESRLTATNASSTALTATTLYATNATIGSASALALLTSGAVSGYGGTGACGAGTAVTALSATGVSTCTAFSTFANPFGTGTTYNTLSAATTTPVWLQGSPFSLFASSTAVIDYASSTTHSISGALYIPSAANPTLNASSVTGTSRVAIDTTDASSSIHWFAGGNEYATFASTSVSFTYATTSPAGTTTIVIAGPIRKVIYDQIGCVSVGGTVTVGGPGTGSATSTYVISGTSFTTTYTKLTSNNSYTQGVSRLFALGNWSSTAVTQVTCTLSQAYDPN